MGNATGTGQVAGGGKSAAVASGAGAVEVNVTIAAEAATVFRFLSDPERFAKWMTAGDGSRIELRPGGELRVAYPGRHVVLGNVVEVTPNSRLVFTYGYEGGIGCSGMPSIEPGSTRVEITLKPSPEGTVVTLRQTGLPTEDLVRLHGMGWRHHIAILAGAVTNEAFGPGLERLAQDYVASWNETDAGKRRALLERVWEPGGKFSNAFGLASGIDLLDLHIAGAQMQMPGMTLAVGGPVQEVHGWVRMPWKVVAGVATVASGVNVMRLSKRGKVNEVVGFWDSGPGAK